LVRRLFKLGLLGVVAVIGLEAAYAALRPVPEQPEFDPSGEFGDRKHATLKVAVLGDSSITAPGVADPDQIWVRILVRRMSIERHVVLNSVAVGGATAASVIAGQLDTAVAWKPDLVLVSVGANDAIHGVPVGRFKRDLETIASRLRDSGAEVVLSGVGDLGTIPRLQPPLRGLATRRSLAYDRTHQRVAERVGALWLNPRQDDRELWIRDRSLWSEDLFHVSAHGHTRWAEFSWNTLQPVMARLNG